MNDALGMGSSVAIGILVNLLFSLLLYRRMYERKNDRLLSLFPVFLHLSVVHIFLVKMGRGSGASVVYLMILSCIAYSLVWLRTTQMCFTTKDYGLYRVLHVLATIGYGSAFIWLLAIDSTAVVDIIYSVPIYRHVFWASVLLSLFAFMHFWACAFREGSWERVQERRKNAEVESR